MKMTFKDWNLIHTALIEKAQQVKSNLKWHQEYHKDDPDYTPDETERMYSDELEALTAVIRKIETASI